ncbi:MAG: DNA starvation/stationary phase protection protein [Paracoccus denitrificans]|nr:MAG: DNA starvation/stationary phase protection protein [Paracoccus denitrificans]PZO84507.1 MAG: DNA starvation/stationary phase protection protein [Paracoccus denitrificans]
MTQTAAQLSTTAQEAIAEALNQAVAETVVGTKLAQNFHWNVTGMSAGSLHVLFQTIYEDHFQAEDDLAERVRALGVFAQGSLTKMLQTSKVKDYHGGHIPAEEMIRLLVAAEEQLAATLGGVASVAEQNGDLLTQDLAIERGRVHEKFAWLLRAHIEA